MSQHQRYPNQFRIIAILVMLILLVPIVSAEFKDDDASTWLEDLKKFEELGDKDTGWEKASKEIKDDFVNEYAKTKSEQDIEILGLDSDDFKWEGNKLVAKTNGKELGIDFDSLRKTLSKISYDESSKSLTYTLKGKDGELSFTFDEGYVNAEGQHILDDYKRIKVNINYGYGEISYKNGEYTVSGAAIKVENRDEIVAMIQENKGITKDGKSKAVVKISSDGSLSHSNSNVQVTGVDYEPLLGGYAGTTKTPHDRVSVEFVSGHSPVALFMDSKDHFKHDGAWQQVNFADKSIIMDAKDSYSVARLHNNFESIRANGEHTYVINGGSTLHFKGGDVNLLDKGKSKGAYDVTNVMNLVTPVDSSETGKVYTWSRSGDNPYTDFFDKKVRIAQVIATSVSGWSGKRMQQLATTSAQIEYGQEFQKEYFKGTEAERRIAIINDPNTIVRIRFPNNHPIPGQFVAAELMSTLDLGMIVGRAKLGSDTGMMIEGLKSIVGASDDIEVVSGRRVSEEYTGLLNYQEAAKTHEMNRFLNTLAKDYAGDMYNLRTNTRGVTSLVYTNDGVYINDRKYGEVNSRTAGAFRNMLASNLFYYKAGKGILNPDFVTYDKAIRENHAFYEDIKKDPFQGYIFGPRYGPRGRIVVPFSRVQAAIAGKSTVQRIAAEKRKKYEYYKNKNSLP